MQSLEHTDPVGLETLEIFAEATAMNRWLYETIKVHLQGDILEIGSGIGNISTFLLSGQSAVYLSDLREEYCKVLEKKFIGHQHLGGIYLLDLSHAEFKIRYSHLLEKFDTVIALNVIEHIQDHHIALANAKALLRTGGKLVVLVPALPGLYNSLDRHLGHIRRYTKKTLKNLFVQAGLKFGSSRYFNTAAIPGWWYSGSILKEEIVTPVKLGFFNRLVPLFRIVDMLSSRFVGISLISTGIKIKKLNS